MPIAFPSIRPKMAIRTCRCPPPPPPRHRRPVQPQVQPPALRPDPRRQLPLKLVSPRRATSGLSLGMVTVAGVWLMMPASPSTSSTHGTRLSHQTVRQVCGPTTRTAWACHRPLRLLQPQPQPAAFPPQQHQQHQARHRVVRRPTVISGTWPRAVTAVGLSRTEMVSISPTCILGTRFWVRTAANAVPRSGQITITASVYLHRQGEKKPFDYFHVYQIFAIVYALYQFRMILENVRCTKLH